MENHAPIVFLQAPGAEQADPAPVAAMILLGGVLGILVVLAMRAARRLRDGGSAHRSGPRHDARILGARHAAGRGAIGTLAAASPAIAPPAAGTGDGACTWRRELGRHGATLQRWTCTACGAEGFTQDERPPKDCKRALRPTAL